MHLILASGSPRRRELLQEAGFEFDVMIPSETAECGACSNTGPAELVAELAVQKAADVVTRFRRQQATAATDHRQPVVLAADTVAECDGHVLGKPRDEEHARQILELLNGREHRVYTGVCVWPLRDTTESTAADPFIVEVDTTTLRMDKLSAAQLDEYLASGQWRGKAGAFGYQDRLGWVHIVEGSESNVVGLPLERLKRMLSRIR